MQLSDFNLLVYLFVSLPTRLSAYLPNCGLSGLFLRPLGLLGVLRPHEHLPGLRLSERILELAPDCARAVARVRGGRVAGVLHG